MSIKNLCPECAETLKSHQSRCACGWTKKNTITQVRDERCCFQLEGVRCKLPGTTALGIKSNRWYCSAHLAARHDSDLSAAILHDINSNFAEWTSCKSWRIRMLEKKLSLQNIYKTDGKKNLPLLLAEIKNILLPKG